MSSVDGVPYVCDANLAFVSTVLGFYRDYQAVDNKAVRPYLTDIWWEDTPTSSRFVGFPK